MLNINLAFLKILMFDNVTIKFRTQAMVMIEKFLFWDRIWYMFANCKNVQEAD